MKLRVRIVLFLWIHKRNMTCHVFVEMFFPQALEKIPNLGKLSSFQMQNTQRSLGSEV